MSLDKSLNEAMKQIPECVAAGFVDLSTGMLLGVKTLDSHPAEVLEIVAAATSDMFQGANVSLIENLFKKARGTTADARHYFQEMIVNSENLLHLFLRCKGNEDLVAVFVCRKSANMGMVLTKGKGVLSSLEAAV